MAGCYSSIALMATLCFYPLSAHSRVWFVRNDGTGDAPTIQAATDSTSAGDTIMLAAGTFTQHIWCEHLDDVTFTSEEGAGTTILRNDWQGPTFAFTWCTGITIEGLVFESSPASAIYCYWTSELTVRNSAFSNNEGGLSLEKCGSSLIHSNIFAANRIAIALTEYTTDAIIRGNTILQSSYAGIYMPATISATIENNIICGGSYGMWGAPISSLLVCNDVFENSINYSIYPLPDPTGTNGNISLDAQFCAADPTGTGNYFLQSDSPCAPGNHPDGYSCGLIGRYPVGCGATATERKSWGEIKSLF